MKTSPVTLTHLLSSYYPPVSPGSLFISLEGIEGAGKSTQISEILTFLKDQGFQTLQLREPGGTPFGEGLREAILKAQTPLHPLAECHLFLSSRAQLLHQRILPFLQGAPQRAVILDRYLDSTLSYQGVARGLGLETILALHQHGPLSTLPHRTYFLDIDLATSFERQKKRGAEKDYFESETTEFYAKLIQGYAEAQKLFPERIKRVDATLPPREVTDLILDDLSTLISSVRQSQT